ncbi:50S ribosomal protein L4 [Candidatus Uhrbacteria bacterium RIFCSPHIGHO2_12_FULL_57_11]|uniref:Large ribosomal subunit protein uL4 n=2 Tax=Candidatus Uhriibacteriota TaxID=1752732 RepID=A0A1F7UJS2_9BACT|nr:MAG: 50S ribosomal protein L4 [Candidatus Uhrbacteria bacterium RIFCSPHIGHO2_02_FULL_57_19]OGL78533.1 MAG: 50S ribosomal protein L4 [Candidatus Uhrbacteria bacterium RIFCSPHIGHO2_12_FULL_57_11]
MKKLSTIVYTEEGKPTGEIDLNPAVFGVAVKPQVLQQAIIAQRANARRSVAHTKTRGEVRGGGRKPWRQKGTGRARHGSTRSPIWVGGGVTFGPRSERNFEVKLNRKTRVAAIRMALTEKVADGKLIVLESLAFPEYKTKRMAGIMGKLPTVGRKTLLVLPVSDGKVSKSAANIPAVTTRNAGNLNVIDLVNNSALLTTREGVKRIEGIYGPKK